MKKQLITRIGLTIGLFLMMAEVGVFAQVKIEAKSKQDFGQVTRAVRPIPNQYIVVLKDDVGAEDLMGRANAIAGAFGGEVRNYYSKVLKGFSARMSKSAAAALSKHPLVAFVEEDEEVEPSDTQVNPPNWGLDRIDQRNYPLDNMFSYSWTGAGVNAYVIDTGIAMYHTEFAGRVFALGDVVNDGTPFGGDCHGHGTKVAGIIGGTKHGVAKRVNLFSVRIGDCVNGSASKSEAIAGLEIVYWNHVKPAVVNLSYNFTCNGSTNDCREKSAVDIAAKNLINAGVTVVTSAGNHDEPVWTSPAIVPEVLTVGAVMPYDRRLPSTAYGPSIDVFAPGWENMTTSINGGSALFSYTSAASPHVAGAVAQFLQANPTALPAQAHQHIVANATLGKVSNIPPNSSTPNRVLYIQP